MATVTATVPDLSGDNLTSWLQSEHKTLLDLLRAAWGITLVSYTGSEDVGFRSYSQSGGVRYGIPPPASFSSELVQEANRMNQVGGTLMPRRSNPYARSLKHSRTRMPPRRGKL